MSEDKRYEDELFKRLSNSLAMREEETILGRYFDKPVWWMLQRVDKTLTITLKDIKQHCEISADADKSKALCLNELCDAFDRAKRSKKAERFKCPFGFSGFCYPIVQGKKIYGYIAMCHAQREIPQVFIDLFVNFVDTLVKETQKELQLSKLYDTIRPRAIALSTVHTVHRLLTSTLNLDELLQRMARLSIQIVRTKRCSIKLVDKAKRVLLPKTTVDLRKKKVKLKKVKVGMYAPGRAFKKARVIMGKDYMAVPLIDQDVIGVITLYDKTDGTPFSEFDKEIMSTLAEQAVIAINNAMLYKEQEKMTEGTIKSMASLLESHAPGKLTPRAPYIRIVLEIGKVFRLSKEELKSLEYAYLLHDVGKAVLPPSILSKSAKLTGKEYKLIKEHPLRGAKIIKPLKALRACAPIILHQRERYDGKGYPDKLEGNKIPLGARIIAVASAFESMTVKRSYYARKSIVKAINEIKKNSGTQFDPKVVDAFSKVVNRRHIIAILRREGHGIR
ncbi:MAG: HD domain-containing protein [Candidatus Omnitrophica bacterium]|nr:HD domain-containing protein [Candidatus Omnitrophota bacterium]